MVSENLHQMCVSDLFCHSWGLLVPYGRLLTFIVVDEVTAEQCLFVKFLTRGLILYSGLQHVCVLNTDDLYLQLYVDYLLFSQTFMNCPERIAWLGSTCIFRMYNSFQQMTTISINFNTF